MTPLPNIAALRAHLARGGVIAYPTESCYGLGCDPKNARAVARILHLQGRPTSKGLILIGSAPPPFAAYLPHPPPACREEYLARLTTQQRSADPLFFTVIDNSNQAVGTASYLRIQPEAGSIEVGYIHFTPKMQRRPLSSEAMFLMMSHAFEELGYRRDEWKCDSLNAPSRAAALRLGFTFEAIFRQDIVVKVRNRETT